MMARPAIAVLIACHNRREKTLACLRALAHQQTAAALHPVVYDDASTDGTGDAVRACFPDATVLPGTGSAFWSGGMRAAFDHALKRDFDFYLWLNDDVVLEASAIARLLAAARDLTGSSAAPLVIGGAVRDSQTLAFSYGGIRLRHSSGSPLRFVAVEPLPDQMRDCDTLHGNVVLIPRATAAIVGSIGPAFIHTLGDLDYGLRVRGAGGQVVLAPGFVGFCDANPGAQRWFDPATPVRDRWRLLRNPLGFPLRPWFRFARAHGGPVWPVFALAPLWRLFVPSRLALAVLRARRSHVQAA